MDNYLIISFVLLPLLGFFLTAIIREDRERLISNITIFTIGTTFFSLLNFVIYWIASGSKPLNINEITIYQGENYTFIIDFYFDATTATFLLVGAFIAFLIVRYSSYYMHLEQGYRRFFDTILFFYFSYNFTLLSGNFETLFMAWEMLGISSFLLIAFYRHRYLPVRNAVKVFSIYRIGDVGILLAMWASHHLWHENITFMKLHNASLVHHFLEGHSGIGVFIAICLLVAAAAKSAQFPFSAWVPRAMEGPTPSSAIFYGSLSIHFGLYLLIRTMPFWEQQPIARILIGLVGLTTAFTSYFTSKVQPTIKTQIAYASVAQIGLMFFELALGFQTLALIHFVGNAFLRTYQLLVSPSVVSYLIREQFYTFDASKKEKKYFLPKKFHYALYLLALREFELDTLMSRFVFKPFKKVGNRLNFLNYKNIFYYFVPAYLVSWGLFFLSIKYPDWLEHFLPSFFAAIALLLVMRSFTEHKYPRLAWLLVVLGHFWIALAVMHNERFGLTELIWYLSGVVITGLVGWVLLEKLRNQEKPLFRLYRYYGHIYEHPRLAGAFLICTLGLMGFPITTTFIGEDLIFSHIHEDQFVLAFFVSSCFVISGISLIRLYSRLFLGSHAKVYHETPLQSA